MQVRACPLIVLLAALTGSGLSWAHTSAAFAQADSCGKPVIVTPGVERSPEVVQGFSGYTMVGWRDGVAAQIALLDPAGRYAPGWPENGLVLVPNGVNASAPQLLTLSEDAILVAWHRTGALQNDVYSALFIRSGATAPTANDAILDTVTYREGAQVLPQLVRQDSHHALVVMENITAPVGTLIKQVSLPGAVVTGWPAGGVAFTDTAYGNRAISACSDDNLGCFVLVSRVQPGCIPALGANCPIHLRIFHFLADGTLDPTWAGGHVVVTEQGGWDGSGEVVSDGTGGVYVRWYRDTGDTLSIYGKHFRRDGTLHPGWDSRGLALIPHLPSASVPLQEQPRLAVTSAGRLIVMLENEKVPYAISREPNGSVTPGWPDAGLLLYSGPYLQGLLIDFQVGVTPTDFIIATWGFVRYADQSGGLMGIGLTAGGAILPGWPADQILCENPGSRYGSRLAVGSDGTFSMAWVDNRPAREDGIYFDRYNITDGTVPTLATARLLDHSLIGRRLWASWQLDAGSIAAVEVLRSLDEAAFTPVSPPRWTSATSLTVEDTLPPNSARARYVLTVSESGIRRALSDTLEIHPDDQAQRMALRGATIQHGHELSFELTLADRSGPIDISVFDVAGRRIQRTRMADSQAGLHSLQLRLDQPTSGILLIEAKSLSGARASTRVVLIQ